jgi:hypothetical protein
MKSCGVVVDDCCGWGWKKRRKISGNKKGSLEVYVREDEIQRRSEGSVGWDGGAA